MRRPEFIARQSARPAGLLGRVIAWVMAGETAAENAAALACLALSPSDRLLEIGFGHGRTIERAAITLTQGFVAGVDVSETMVDMATRRCASLIRSGRVALRCGDGVPLPFPDHHFDKALGVHTLYFWPDPRAQLEELRRVLKDGGRLVLAFRPKDDEQVADFPANIYRFYAAADVRRLLEECGFERIETTTPPAARGMTLVSAHRPVP